MSIFNSFMRRGGVARALVRVSSHVPECAGAERPSWALVLKAQWLYLEARARPAIPSEAIVRSPYPADRVGTLPFLKRALQ